VRRLGRRQIEGGVHFLVPCGTTGENPTLLHEERLRIVEILVDEAKGQVPVLAGAGGYDTKEVIHLAADLASRGASGFLSVTPYYNKPTQEGLYRHFRAVAEKVGLPLWLYNVPARTMADLATETVLRLAQVPNIVGLKDATSDLVRHVELMKRLPRGREFALYSGNDDTALAYMLLGGHGVISVTANVAPKLMSEMCAAARRGDLPTARAINERLSGLHARLFVEANPIPVKWALSAMGLIDDELRLPLTSLSPQFHDAVRAALTDAGCLSRELVQ
jgi:4-hydroxy-tetrahydrodipicolinate synthase